MSMCSGDGLVLGNLTSVKNIIESVETNFNAVLICRRAENDAENEQRKIP